MLWRFLILLSVLPIAAGLLLHWWFGLRILARYGARAIHCQTERWEALAGVAGAPETTADFGQSLRQAALRRWRDEDSRKARSREGTHRFGMAVPPLTAMVAGLGMLSGRVLPMAAIAAFVVATALATVFCLLSLGSELQAIAAMARELRRTRVLPRTDDEDAVIACAAAHAWRAALPPVLRWIVG